VSKRVKDLVTADKNPLPRSIQIKVDKPENLEDVNSYIASRRWESIIRENGISYQKNKTIIERLNNITKFVEKVGFILALVFLGISILVIFNTVRLNIISRKDEIEIQRLVGATNGFIQAPFIVEGILYGLLATGLSTLFIYLLIRYTTPMISQYLGEVSFNLEDYFRANLFLIISIQFLIGVFVGSVCSLISVKKYLKI
ncbi:MAG: FtsX-like permease family protein, partial [Candidatus Berkelbacteria bacterium]|nr:FtsX-like permease family protein [Candidatus Berkelbacteria bacterium]